VRRARTARGQEALGPQDHHDDEGDAEDEHTEVLEVAELLREGREEDGTGDDAGNAPHAAQHDHAQDDGALHEDEAHGVDEGLHVGEQESGDAGERCPHAEGKELHLHGVDAHRLRGQFVLP
jgi:hypothetical protein